MAHSARPFGAVDLDLDLDSTQLLPEISQRRLRMIVGLSNQIHDLEAQLARYADRILDDMMSGCSVAPGSHRANLHTTTAHDRSEQALVVDGVERYRRETRQTRRLPRRPIEADDPAG